MSERDVTLGDLIEQCGKFLSRKQLFGTTAQCLERFNALRDEIPKHYTEGQWERLAQDTILPPAIAQRYVEFRDYFKD